MGSRRDFLKAAATGALALGAQSKLGFAAVVDQQAGKSKVVVARDAALHGPGARLDAKRAADLLDRPSLPTRAEIIRSRRGSKSFQKPRS